MDERLAEIETLYRTRYPTFLRTATAILGEREAARDAVQEAFAAAVRKRAEFRGSGSLEGWVWRILVNTARSGRRVRPPTAVHPVPEPATDNGADPDPEAGALRALLAALPERQRLVVFLRYFADLDYDGIAAALDIRPGTVGATLNSVHAVLRRRLEEVPR
jgi:RNA polymerase sigma-70 factor (ECF subfamily)